MGDTPICCHWQEGYDAGYIAGAADALDDHVCDERDPVEIVNRNGACVRCGRSGPRTREIFNGVTLHICGDCDDPVLLDQTRIAAALRLALA